jgi:L-ascorbate metabolism protein UlaG (beta-lactamase superfamily)
VKINHTISLAPQLRIRWLTIACFEVQIGDFSVVIDPCIGASPRAGFGAEVVEKADVILLSHGHWDHTTDIKALMDRFNCPVLCGELTAPALLRYLNCNPKYVYPVAPNLELDFGGAKIKALFGRHCDQRATLAQKEQQMRQNPLIDSPEMLECNFFGHMEYRNFLITAPSGLKVMFWGNDADPVQLNIIRQLQPEIALLQYTRQKPEELAQMVLAGNVKVLIPHHMDLFKDEAEYEPLIELLEEEVHKVAPDCLVISPERLKWYQFGMTVSADM